MVNPEFQTHVLPNGLRIIHAWMPREVTHCALVVNAGTRDEGEGEAGLAHFIEHVLFKGTQKRKAFHILNRMESVGGEINAYTTKGKQLWNRTHALQTLNHFWAVGKRKPGVGPKEIGSIVRCV